MNRETIIANIGELSVTPRVIRHLARFVDDPNADIGDTVAAVRAEPILATALLAACNTPTYFRGKHVVDVADAVQRLGRRETYRILLLITFRQGLRIANLPDSAVADRLWRRAIIVAFAMEALVPEELRPSAYTIGLLHLIGCFVLARNGFDYGTFFDPTSAATLARIERESLGIDHPEAGGLALERWHFPALIHGPIRWQLAVESAGEHAKMAEILAEATRIAQLIAVSIPTPSQRWSASPPATGIDPVIRTIECNAHDLMECFGLAPSARPHWVTQVASHQ